MTEGLSPWIGRLEAEIARELGQTVSFRAGGDAPEAARSLSYSMEIPGARLALGADRDDVAAFLTEARVIEAGQADAEMVEELWSGILASVAARLGGKGGTGASDFPGESCTLTLGGTTMRLSIGVRADAAAAAAKKPAPAPPPPAPASDDLRRPQGSLVGNLDLLLDVELDASVRFGSCEMELKDLLELGPGDVVELNRHVADPVDLVVGDRIVARGEVVLVNGNFGLRVTEVAEPVRRLESIRCVW